MCALSNSGTVSMMQSWRTAATPPPNFDKQIDYIASSKSTSSHPQCHSLILFKRSFGLTDVRKPYVSVSDVDPYSH